MAPEQLRFEEPTKFIDQWSLAVVASEMLTGHGPFTGSEHAVFHAILNSDPDLQQIPAELRTPLAKALSKQPDSRFPSCVTFIDTLAAARQAAAGGPSVTTAPPRVVTGATANRARSSSIVAALVIAIDYFLRFTQETRPQAQQVASVPSRQAAS